MIYTFRVFSDEVDTFEREVQIDSHASFIDLLNVVLDSVNYDKSNICSFFVCSDDWEKELEITQIEMDNNPEVDAWVMDKTPIDELVEDQGQKLVLMFDYLTERGFYMELESIQSGSLAQAVCVSSLGEAPQQSIDFDEFEKKAGAAGRGANDMFDDDNNFYGDSEFDMDELEDAGFSDDLLDDF